MVKHFYNLPFFNIAEYSEHDNVGKWIFANGKSIQKFQVVKHLLRVKTNISVDVNHNVEYHKLYKWYQEKTEQHCRFTAKGNCTDREEYLTIKSLFCAILLKCMIRKEENVKTNTCNKGMF